MFYKKVRTLIINKELFSLNWVSKRRHSPETANSVLVSFLSDTEWLIFKCGVYTTNPIEPYNASKSWIAPKQLPLKKLFEV